MLAMAECRMRDAGLSLRERQVTWLLLEGMDVPDMCDHLDISDSAARNYIYRAAHKFGFDSGRQNRVRIACHLLCPTEWELAAIAARTDREAAW